MDGRADIEGPGFVAVGGEVQPEGGMFVQFTPSPGSALKFWQIGMLRGVGIEPPLVERSLDR